MDLKVIEVKTRRELRDFLTLPERLFHNNPHWIAPPSAEDAYLIAKDALDQEIIKKGSNPFWKSAYFQLFLARLNNRTVGRIAAIVDEPYTRARDEMAGFFGYFDCINKDFVARALFNTASRWLYKNDMRKVLCPVNPTFNHPIGVLCDAFKIPPLYGTVWNPPYYPYLYEQAFFIKYRDIKTWTIRKEEFDPARFADAGTYLHQMNLVLQNMSLNKNFQQEMSQLFSLNNRSWISPNSMLLSNPHLMEKEDSDVRGAQFTERMKRLLPVIDPNLAITARSDKEPFGYIFGIKDLNRAEDQVRSTSGIIKAPKRWWLRRKIDTLRVFPPVVNSQLKGLMGIEGLGLEMVLISELMKRAFEGKYNTIEFTNVMEINQPLNKVLEYFGMTPTRTHRIYERPLQ